MADQSPVFSENASRAVQSLLLRLDAGQIHFDQGRAYSYGLPPDISTYDSDATPFRSQARLFEDSAELGPRHVPHEQIRALGRGRISHWRSQLYFSTSDNSSPIDNGREYHLLIPGSGLANRSPVFSEIQAIDRSLLLRLDPDQIHFGQGHAYIYGLPLDMSRDESDMTVLRSQPRLFEDGVELRPRRVPHDQIRALGRGRISHWRNQLYFSTSDNSSPIDNGREYHVLIPAGGFSIEDSSLERMAPVARFAAARALYRKLWQDTPLPDHDRRIDHDASFTREFTRLSPENDVTHERKYNLDQLFKLVLRVEGDVAECGAYKGGSAFFLARHIVEEGLNKRLCLFDSFEGLSVPGKVDGNHWYAGALSSTIEDVKNALAPLGAVPFVEFYKGWIPERFSEVTDRRFCFVHIDVDLFDPTLSSIAFFYPRMAPGGIILLDDYGFDTCPGVTAAIDQFMRRHPEPVINLASGGAFIMTSKADRSE